MTSNPQGNTDTQVRTEKQDTVQFLLEEYRNIAETHDKLRDVAMRLVYYILILSAFPFTLAGFIFSDKEFNLFNAPLSLHLLFLVVGLAIFVLALALLDARLSQYRYARTVNEIRRYFAENDPGLRDFLYLPTTKQIPDMRNLGFIGTQLWFILLIGAIFAGYGAIVVTAVVKWRWLVFCLVVIFYLLCFRLIRRHHTETHEKMIGR